MAQAVTTMTFLHMQTWLWSFIRYGMAAKLQNTPDRLWILLLRFGMTGSVGLAGLKNVRLHVLDSALTLRGHAALHKIQGVVWAPVDVDLYPAGGMHVKPAGGTHPARSHIDPRFFRSITNFGSDAQPWSVLPVWDRLPFLVLLLAQVAADVARLAPPATVIHLGGSFMWRKLMSIAARSRAEGGSVGCSATLLIQGGHEMGDRVVQVL